MALPTSLKTFLNHWRTYLVNFWIVNRDCHRLPSSINHGEVLARYLLYKKGYFSEVENRVKRRAFMPEPVENETSVYRIEGARDSLIWAIGKLRVSDPQKRSLYGRADIVAFHVTDIDSVLQLRADRRPKRHAAIAGWPLEESHKISIAQELAERATLRLKTQ